MAHQPRQVLPAPAVSIFCRSLRGLRYSFMSQRVTSGFLSMICVYLCVFAVGPGIRDGAGAIMIRKGPAFGQSGRQLIVNILCCRLIKKDGFFQRPDTWLELSPQGAGACIAVGQAFQPDSSGCQAGKPDLLK